MSIHTLNNNNVNKSVAVPQGCEGDIEVNVSGQHSLTRHYPSRHYHNTTIQQQQQQCDTKNSNKKMMGYSCENKGLVSILTSPEAGSQQPSIISHISSVKDNSIAMDHIQLVSNPNSKKDCVISRHQQHGHQHSFSSTLPIPSKAVNLRCHPNDDGGSSDTSTIHKSVHFEKLPYPQKVQFQGQNI